MRKLLIFILIAPLFILSGCTQNNGYIGPIFGSWSLLTISEDGVPLPQEYQTIFSFQNEVVQVSWLLDPPYTVQLKYGNFSIDDKILTLKFQNHPTPDDSYMFVTPDWLYFPPDASVIPFEIRKINGSEMIWILTTDNGSLEYRFKKTW